MRYPKGVQRLLLHGLALTVVIAGAAGAARTVIDEERGLVFLDAWQNDWSHVGATVGTQSSYWGGVSNDHLKILHARLHCFNPADDTGWVFFPYTRFKAYEKDELAHGRGPLWVTATYAGKVRPVIWWWSTGFVGEGNAPKRPASYWKQAVRLDDDRFIKFYLHEFVFNVKKSHERINQWEGGDECAFMYGLYGVIDDQGKYHGRVKWDRPFPQNDDEYIRSVSTMFKKFKRWAPDVRFLPNLGSIDQSKFTTAYQYADGLMVEDVLSDSSRKDIYDWFINMAWMAAQNKVVMFRSYIKKDDNYPRHLRTGYVSYLMARGDNFFWGPCYQGTSKEINPADYAEAKNALGKPTAPLVFRPEPGKEQGGCLYTRTCEGGIACLNWTGVPKTIALPPGRWYNRQGEAVTALTVPDRTGDYVVAVPGRRAAIPTISPIRPDTVTGPLIVTLSTTTSGGTIHYTTDNSTPDNASTRYTGPFTLSKSCTFKAVTCAAGMTNSHVGSTTYALTAHPPAVEFYVPADANSEFVCAHYPLVKLAHASASPVTINYAVVGGTTQAGLDYTCPAGTLTFSPGEVYKRFKIAITDDKRREADQTVVIRLSKPVNATLGRQDNYTYAITDND